MSDVVQVQLDADGKLQLPEAVRAALKASQGTVFDVVQEGQAVLLRPHAPRDEAAVMRDWKKLQDEVAAAGMTPEEIEHVITEVRAEERQRKA